MGMILKNKLPSLQLGKYTEIGPDRNIIETGTISTTSAEGKAGDLVKFATDGTFVVVDGTNTITKVSEVAGVILSPYARLVTDFFGGVKAETIFRKGEAFDRYVKGKIALELDSALNDFSTIKPNTPVYLTSKGKVTTTSASNIATDWTFTGVTETDDAGRKLVEVFVCHCA